MSIVGLAPVGLNLAPAYILAAGPIVPAPAVFLGRRSSYGFDSVEVYWIEIEGPILPAESITVRIHRFSGLTEDIGYETNIRNHQPRIFPTDGADDIDFEITAVNTEAALVSFFIAGSVPLRFRTP
jgi:hypothetical protein